MSRHSDAAAIAQENHKYYFGEYTGVEYRETDRCEWSTITNAIVHGEYISTVQKGMTRAKVTKRDVYCDIGQAGRRINAHIRIGGANGQIYTVVDITTHSGRLQLHLQRADIVEVARPDFRRQ